MTKITNLSNRNSDHFITLACFFIIISLASIVRFPRLEMLGPFIDEINHIYFLELHSLVERTILGGKVFGSLLFHYTTRLTNEPLYYSRFFLAFLGVMSSVGMFLCAKKLSGLLAGVFAGIIWSLLPYVVFHDRLALFDPMVSCFTIWAIFFQVEAIKKKHWVKALISGLLLGLAILTKTTALLNVLWLILISIALIEHRYLRSYSTIALAFFVGLAIPLILLAVIIGPYLTSFLEYTDRFTNASPDSLNRRGLIFVNLDKLYQWLKGYNSTYFILLLLLNFILILIRPSKITVALTLSFLISLTIHIYSLEIWFSRYFLPSLIPLILLLAIVSSDWLSQVRKNWLQADNHYSKWLHLLFVGLICILMIIAISGWLEKNLTIQSQPDQIQIPADDLYQYVTGWPSGSGLVEVATFLEELSTNADHKILVITGGFGRHGYWSIPMLMMSTPNIEFSPLRTGSKEELRQFAFEASNRRTFILLEPPVHELSIKAAPLISPFLRLSFEYERPHAEGGFQIYEVDHSAYKSIYAQ